MRHQKLDLNLLVALDALLRTANVTQAAQEVHVSQPSMSGSLARLREHFNDPLLLKAGRVMKLTPLAVLLRDSVRETLQQVDRTICLRPTFDPASDARTFTLSASDYTALVLGAPLVRRLSELAPLSTVVWLPGSPLDLGQKLQSAEVDLTFVAEPFVDRRHGSMQVIEDDFVCIAWTGNTQVQNGLSKEVFLSSGHVDTHYGSQSTPGASHIMNRDLGLSRRVEVICTSPALLGPMVIGTPRLATLARSLATNLARGLPLQVFDHPWTIPAARIFMQWNTSREGDAAIDWLRGLVIEVAESLERTKA